MQFKDNDKWLMYNTEAQSKNDIDNLSAAVEWAENMESQLSLNMEFSSLAYITLQRLRGIHVEINTKDYAYIVKVLGECWKNGDDLLKWHNQKYAGVEATSFVAVPNHM